MELTAKNVEDTLRRCLFEEGEPTEDRVEAHGVMLNAGFHPGRLKQEQDNIHSMLVQLPSEFMDNNGGGHTFLNAYKTKDDIHWGEHRDIDNLMVLGLATGFVSFPLPRSMWPWLPGSMPYFTVKTALAK